ncbi:ATP-binding protein [Candidatus Sumerlaeota bacterium]|nr:ATP-binding protein [Candidatus Sumerlaeota bacterium]
MEEAYADFADSGFPPRLRDLLPALKKVFCRKGYSSDTLADFRTALEVRLGNLTRRSVGRIFQCRNNIPDIEELVGGLCLLELDSLPAEVSCFVILLILRAIWNHVKSTPSQSDGLRLVVILEEAHVLLGRNSVAAPSEEFADPKSFATEFVCRMLAELRALGVGVIIADQLPSAIAPEVIKNTATKLTLRQVDAEDREILGRAMLFGQSEMEDIARLEPGEAFFHTEGYYGPRRIKTIDFEQNLKQFKAPTDEELLAILKEEAWWLDMAKRRQESELLCLHEEMGAFVARLKELLAGARSIAALLSKAKGGDSVSPQQRQRLVSRAVSLRQRIEEEVGLFRREVFEPLLGQVSATDNNELRELRDQRVAIAERFEKVRNTACRSGKHLLGQIVSQHHHNGAKEASHEHENL